MKSQASSLLSYDLLAESAVARRIMPIHINPPYPSSVIPYHLILLLTIRRLIHRSGVIMTAVDHFMTQWRRDAGVVVQIHKSAAGGGDLFAVHLVAALLMISGDPSYTYIVHLLQFVEIVPTGHFVVLGLWVAVLVRSARLGLGCRL